MTPDWTDDTNGPLMGRASLLTLTIVAGLRQGLAVGQHGHFRHGHAHHGAFFVSLVLNTEERDEETQSFLHGKSWFDWKKKDERCCGSWDLAQLSYFDIRWVSVGGGDVWLPVFGGLGQVFGVCHHPLQTWPTYRRKALGFLVSRSSHTSR